MVLSHIQADLISYLLGSGSKVQPSFQEVMCWNGGLLGSRQRSEGRRMGAELGVVSMESPGDSVSASHFTARPGGIGSGIAALPELELP